MAKVIPLPTAQAPAEQPKERFSRRKDGLYQLELRYTLPDGSKKKKSFYGKTQSEAIEKRKAFERELALGKNVNRMDVKVSTFIDEWLEVYKANVSFKTLASYTFDAGLLKKKYGNLRIRDITLTHIQTIINGRAGLSKSAVKKTAMTLRAIFETARADRIIAYNPCDKLVLPDAKEGTHRAITDEERALITESYKDHRFHLAAMLMLYAGLRRGEVMALNISRDVDFKKKVINVSQGIQFENNRPVLGAPKSKSGVRSIPIFPPLMAILKQHKKTGLVLSGPDGSHISNTGFNNVWSSYRGAMELVLNEVDNKRHAPEEKRDAWKPFTVQCHDLRHTFCTMLYDAGVDVKTAQTWMGHADPTITMRIYTHLSAQKQDAALKAANTYFTLIVGKNVGKPSKCGDFKEK